MRLEGQRAIVTGSSSGIGEAIMTSFRREGASVVGLDLNPSTDSIKCDISDAKEVESAVNNAMDRLGRIDILVNNAGFGKPGKLLDTDLADWNRMFEINLTGMFLVSKTALPFLLQGDGKCIINMGSVAGLVGMKERTAYCATKGGVIAFTRAVALDYVEEGLRCNAICPGTIDTPWVERMTSLSTDPKATRLAMTARQPMGRLGSAEDIAQAAVYLSSKDSAFVTGTTMVVDGGMTMQ